MNGSPSPPPSSLAAVAVSAADESGGQTYTNVFTGTVKDRNLIEGTIAVAGVEGTFTAKKP